MLKYFMIHIIRVFVTIVEVFMSFSRLKKSYDQQTETKRLSAENEKKTKVKLE